MQTRIDLNSDMGEGFGRWVMGDDTALLNVVTSANIACGAHAGDANHMATTMRAAVENGVGIGAHPGFNDLHGFGRRQMTLSTDELRNLVTYQVGAAQAMAHSVGGKLRHLKLHGALSNMATENADMARTCFEAALKVQPDLVIMVLAATQMEKVVRELDCAWAGEIFADRAYEDDASLLDRSKPGAVLHDADAAATRILAMLKEGSIITESGKRIPTRIDTICVHGDTKEAVEMATALRGKLNDAGVTPARL